MTIRNASVSDAQSIAKVHVRSWQQAYRGILPAPFLASLSIEKRTENWVQLLTTSQQRVLYAKIDSQIAGFCSFGVCRDPDALPTDFEIWALYLDSSHWSQGIGRQLWLASRDALIADGARRISLWVLKENLRAIKFYLAAGFQPEKDSAKTIEIGGVSLVEVRYSQKV